MEKSEKIFIIIIIISYIICSIALKIPTYVHIMFGAINTWCFNNCITTKI